MTPRWCNTQQYVETRRKKKAVHKTTSTDDKRLQNTLKRLGVNTIPGIEEVNVFMDETVIHFANPKGQIPPHSPIMLARQLHIAPQILTMRCLQSKRPSQPTHMLSAVPLSKRVSSAADRSIILQTPLQLCTQCCCLAQVFVAANATGLYAELQDLLPGIINQLGPDNLSHLKKIASQVSSSCITLHSTSALQCRLFLPAQILSWLHLSADGFCTVPQCEQ